MTVKIGIITGGASGMGFAVAQSLSCRGNWHVHLFDINDERGHDAAQQLHPNATFHRADVTKYDELTKAFRYAFTTHGRIDFVFANAGVIETTNFYAAMESDEPPSEPDLRSIDADLKGVVLTSHLAMHYFRRSPSRGKGANLIITASCGGLYPSLYSPLYSAAKHGVVGFMRSIAPCCFAQDGIRVNAICPGIVQTNLVDKAGWETFPAHRFISMNTISRVVLMLIDECQTQLEGGKDHQGVQDCLVDATGTRVSTGMTYGRAVEISGDNFYFRKQPEFCDEGMREVMAATAIDNQVGGVLKD